MLLIRLKLSSLTVIITCCLVFLILLSFYDKTNLLPTNNNYHDAKKETDIFHHFILADAAKRLSNKTHSTTETVVQTNTLDVSKQIDKAENGHFKTVKTNNEKNKTSHDVTKDTEVPIILMYEQHPLLWFSPFNLNGVCPNHCIFTNDTRVYYKSKAVIFFRSLRKPPPKKLTNQIWVYFTNESPAHIGPVSTNVLWKKASVNFDWLLSYRPRSDIQFPFGVLTKTKNGEKHNYSEIFSRKTKEVAWLVSHCETNSLREVYVKELRKYIQVDIYGTCGDKTCNSPIERADDFTSCKSSISQEYKFYLSFENSLCSNYVTEKVYGVYESDNMMVPVVRGAPNTASFLPNGTYISTSDFSSPKQLAEYLKEVGSSEEKYVPFLKAKHGYKLTPWTENYKTAICQLCRKIKSHTKDAKNRKNIRHRLMEDRCFKPRYFPTPR